MQGHATRWPCQNPLGYAVDEAGEMDQDAGEEGIECDKWATLRGLVLTAGGITAVSPSRR